MHYLKKELDRIVQYAKSLNIKINLTNKSDKFASAEWAADGSEITVYDSNKKSHTQMCLDLIHELSHHMSYIHSGKRTNLKLDYILLKSNTDKPLTKKQRKTIYDMEVKESRYQILIYRELQCKIPLWRLELEIALDHWVYKYYYLHGKLPKSAEVRAKRKQLKQEIKK